MYSVTIGFLESSSKSHMKSSVFLHVFNDISIYAYVFPKYFLNNFSIEFHVVLRMKYRICNTVHVAVINIIKFKKYDLEPFSKIQSHNSINHEINSNCM